jgi:hypothetical protein
MRLIKNWKQSYKQYSQQAKAVAVSITASYMALPEKWQDVLDVKYVMVLTIIVLVLGAIGRVIDQSPSDQP